MTHPYTLEQPTRHAYIEQSRHHVLDILSRSTVQDALGDIATKARILAEELYPLSVAPDGTVAVPDAYIHSDALPILALGDTEQVVRDRTFATFTPGQYMAAPPTVIRHLDTVSRRVAADAEEAFVAQTFQQDASVMRMTYCIPRHPSPETATYFNARPLAILRYDAAAERAEASTVVNTLLMAQLVLDNPVSVVSGEEAFDALNTLWRSAGEHAGTIITQVEQS